MRIIRQVSDDNVWQHWMKVEGHQKSDFRADIRDPLPNSLRWYIAKIEEGDISKLFIISSEDWTEISNGSFRVQEVANRINIKNGNKDTQRISSDIKRKLEFTRGGGILDNFLIAVTDSLKLDGPFTFIEGNRRSVTFVINSTIIGCEIFIGISPDIRGYKWASQSYR